MTKGDIDIGHKQLHAGVSVDVNDRTKDMYKYDRKKIWGDAFHTYQLEWTESES